MAQEQIKKSSQRQDDTQDAELATPGKNEKAEALKGQMDDLLDEIDGVLEENAEEFVSNYRQKGGE